MKRTILGTTAPVLAALVLTSMPTLSHADLAFNIGAVSDYRFRGISQTRNKPALQGGVDYSNGGFYLGAWASNIKWIEDWGGDAKIEIDLYGGYKGEIAKDLGFDVGVLQYVYPSASTTEWDSGFKNPNTTELYGAITSGPFTAKLSYALTNAFGNYDFGGSNKSTGSYYADLSATFDVGGFSVVPHVGYQKINKISNASYTDYSLTISKDFSGIVPSLAIVGTDADKTFYAPGPKANKTKSLGKTGVVVGVKYNF
jgi:uncharacterized protein (TIGR02001 family)